MDSPAPALRKQIVDRRTADAEAVVGLFDARAAAPPAPDAVTVTHLASAGPLHVTVVTLGPGHVIPPHQHAHQDEVFDVVAGAGEAFVAGVWQPFGPGATLFVPAGTWHGLRNPGPGNWQLRETVYQRVYLRAALRAAIAKRWAALRARFGRARQARST